MPAARASPRTERHKPPGFSYFAGNLATPFPYCARSGQGWTGPTRNPYDVLVTLLGESMTLMWHILLDMSFGYLGLIAVTRIVQEVNAVVFPVRSSQRSAC